MLEATETDHQSDFCTESSSDQKTVANRPKYIKHKKGGDVTNLRKKAIAIKRPKSTALEFDKLLRIKSDIQLNITKKVGQIKLRVSSASHQAKERQKRLSSMFYVTPEKLKTDDTGEAVLANFEFPLDERCIYGDDWSSDDDSEATSSSFKQDSSRNAKKTPKDQESTPNSMLNEIEQELKLKYKSEKLPDIVLESKRKSSSLEIPSCNPSASQEVTQNGDAVDKCGIDGDSEEVFEFNDKLESPDIECYQTVDEVEAKAGSVTTNSSPERHCLPSSSSDYTVKEADRLIYTPRIIPDPQPLYQIYMLEHSSNLLYEVDDEIDVAPPRANDDCKVQRTSSTISTDSGRGADSSTTFSHVPSTTSMRRDRLVAGSDYGSQRSLWCELPEVKNSGLLETLDEEMKKLQEAYFEVITSEASYLRSLNVLITHFMAAPELLGSRGPSSVISSENRKQLFSNIFAVRDCSERLLCDLENRLEESLVLSDVCDVLVDHFESNFDAYIKYCSNQVYQDRSLRKLKSENAMFQSSINRLESDRICQGLDMRSFLMLPMQRITRYPLLVIAILERTPPNSAKHDGAQLALHLANKIVTSCNEGARRMDRTEQLLDIERRLIYKSSDLRRIPLVTSGRYLVKHGPLMCLNERRKKGLLQSRQSFLSIHVFLFSDIILIAKKKLNGTFVCKDYSARRFVDIQPIEIDNPKLVAQSILSRIGARKPHLFVCTLMHNARGRQVELLLNAESETDRERWLSALRPPASSNPEEKVYADWDCPQAIAVHVYAATQDDEIPLEKGDLINILRKMPDGWFYGERVRDRLSGWFPSSYVQQVLNDHVRAKNYRHRLRVIQAAADFRYRQEQEKTVDSPARSSQHLIERIRKFSSSSKMVFS